MRRILADVWQFDLRVVEGEFTLIGVNPALDQFKGIARSMREQTNRQARKHGRELAVTTDPAQAPAA
jgi:FMN-dependent NADH-azoreductase